MKVCPNRATQAFTTRTSTEGEGGNVTDDEVKRGAVEDEDEDGVERVEVKALMGVVAVKRIEVRQVDDDDDDDEMCVDFALMLPGSSMATSLSDF